MRFGKQFHRHVLPEWDRYYIDYNVLKQLIKTSVFSGKHLDILGLPDLEVSCFCPIKSLTKLQKCIEL